MLTPTLRVVVVDDDFMIARLHGKFVDAQMDYKLVGMAYSYEQALELIQETKPNLVLLDVFMPDHSGLDLLREIRGRNIHCDAILITAAKELDIVEEGFRLGVFDYLIKPFDLTHLQNALQKYAAFKRRLANAASVDQGMLDDLKKLRSMSHLKSVPSGIDIRTLDRIRHCLSNSNQSKSAEQIAKLAGVSRSTARTYLAHLVESGEAREELLYGTVGRPQSVFHMA